MRFYGNINFITICTRSRYPYFGSIAKDFVDQTEVGMIAETNLQMIKTQFENIILDEFIIMPDHIHMILIDDDHKLHREAIHRVVENNAANTHNRDAIYRVDVEKMKDGGGFAGHLNPMGTKNIGEAVRWFKGRTSYDIHKNTNMKLFKWQNRYYNRIIQDERQLYYVRDYIKNNPTIHAQRRDSSRRGEYN